MPAMTAEARELAEKYVPFARKRAKRWKRRFPWWREDFESAALLGLCEAARAFDRSKGVKFATYAARRINGQLADTWRTLTRQDARPFSEWQDFLDRSYSFCAARPVEDLEDWLARVPSRHGRILRLLYLDGLSQLEASKVIGISQSRLCGLHKEALAILAERKLRCSS